MFRISVPASSANLGSGFDCLGIALGLYNTFTVELDSSDLIENDDPRFNNPDNLFLQAYHRGCSAFNADDHVHVIMNNHIPVSRGLGSSAAMIVGGITAASILHDDALNEDQIFALASEMEGHPDNAAPCVYGGLTASGIVSDRFVTHSLELNPKWHFTVFIPDFEVSTAHARAIMPESYPRKTVSESIANAVWEIEALRTGSLPLLQAGCRDLVHEPYRKQLIKGYDSLKQIVEEKGDGVLLISGSGSTCLLISLSPVSNEQINAIHEFEDVHWDIHELSPCNGTEIRGASDE